MAKRRARKAVVLVDLADVIKAAEENYRDSEAAFQEHDNIDDMHEAEGWQRTIKWLGYLSDRHQRNSKNTTRE